MVLATAATGTATAVGYDVGGNVAAQSGTATAKATGYAALGIPAAPSAGSAPDALRVEIVTAAGTQLVNDFVARRNLSFTVEHNGSGTISFETDLDAVPAGVDLADPTHLVRIHYGDLPGWPYGVAEGVIMAAPPTKSDAGRWVVSVQAPGTWDLLDFGLLWPPDGATGDTREFSYTAGQTGPAWVPEEWGKPASVLVKGSFRWKKRHPRGWPEDKSHWLWSTSPEKTSGNPGGVLALAIAAVTGVVEWRKFGAGTFTLTAKTSVHFYAAGDDTLKLYLNGARIKTKGRGGWKRTASFIRTLKAGTYTVSAEVANLAGSDNKCGFIFAAAALKANGDRDHWLLRSSSTTFQVKTAGGYFAQQPLPPDGWYPAAVLYTHVTEAAARGAAFHSAMTLTFNTTTDSTGAAWTAKGPVEYQISTSGAELGDKVRSSGVDAAMLPGLRLSTWRQRGFDLRDHVTISTPLGIGWPSKTWARVRTVGLTHHELGWTETPGDASVAATYGRRELAISGGGTEGDAQADVLAAAAMTTAASPEETIEATVTSADLRAGAPQPFRDFNVADIVTFETVGGFTPVKVMSITGAEQDSKEVRWTIAGYPV